jgi:hypothetical protein
MNFFEELIRANLSEKLKRIVNAVCARIFLKVLSNYHVKTLKSPVLKFIPGQRH